VSGNLVQRACPVCGSSTGHPFLHKQTLELVRCADCGMVYANPVEEGLSTGLFYDQLAVPFYLSPDKLQSDYSPVRFVRELKLFRSFCRRGSVLDVGCSTGAFLYQLKNKFPTDYDVTGIDVAGPALDHAEKMGVSVMRESFLNTNFVTRHFDAITFWAVIEHLDKPAEFLANAASLLNRGGVCFILVPNLKSLAVRLLGAKYRYIFPQHLNYFTATTLKRFAAQAPGLRILQSCSTHFNPIVIWQDWRGCGQFVPDASRAALLKRTTAYKRHPLLKPLKWALGAAEAFLGQMNLADNIVMVLQKDDL
jgi:2-polyprenyl-3-methyl-5-hydroxy-6-metoxy-1,4-benzoquinol methylase